MRSRLVAGNWKMNGSLAANLRLLESLKAGVHASADAQCAVCVPFPYLAQVQSALTGTSIAWGAQNLSEWAQGAYTGEVSGAMLRDFGCQHVLVGHSERRRADRERRRRQAIDPGRQQRHGRGQVAGVAGTLAARLRKGRLGAMVWSAR